MTPIVSSFFLRTQSDARLVALARQDYDAAFEAIVERYRRPLQRYCARLLPDGRAEDAMQHAFMSAWTALRAGTEVRDLRAWLYRIAHNAALRAIAQTRAEHAGVPDHLLASDRVDEDVQHR